MIKQYMQKWTLYSNFKDLSIEKIFVESKMCLSFSLKIIDNKPLYCLLIKLNEKIIYMKNVQ